MEENNNSNSKDEGQTNGNGHSNLKVSDASKKKKKYKLDDTVPSVFPDEEVRLKLFEHLETIKVKKMKKNAKVLNTIAGPYEVQYPLDVLQNLLCGRSISTYPHIPGKPNRDGDPICDSYTVQLLEDDVAVAVVCNGCNWGRRPMVASNAAKSAFSEYIRNHLGDIDELRDAGHYLLQALSYCHLKIIEGKEDIWEAGTTTLLGGVLFRIKKSKEEVKSEKDKDSFKWVWCGISIGDCKAFHYNAATKKLTDVTPNNRKNWKDAKDPGGRLGPYVGNGEPDLRNTLVHRVFCEENDLILILSDGVHDNLDPQVLGKDPKDAGEQFAHVKDWNSFKDDIEAEAAKSAYMSNFLIRDLILGGQDDEKLRSKVFSATVGEESLSPESIVQRIMKHCLAVTAKGREWMEQNPKERLPSDYAEYPGKMDHATAVVISVTKYSKELAKASGRRNSEASPNQKKA